MSLRLALVLAVAAAPALEAAQPQFWRIEGARDFLDGDLQGLSVDSEGRVRLAPAARPLHDPEVPNLWCAAEDSRGTVYAGSGNDGKIFKIEGGKASLLFDAPELEAHAVAVGPDGRVYVGTGPDGKVYAIDGAGQSTTYFDPGDKYIWALAFDRAGNLFVATGAEGKVYRVDAKGKAQIALTTGESHILSLAVDDKGSLFAGSAEGGVVYRIDPALKVFVVLDSPYREVKALLARDDGSVYVAAVDGKPKDPVTTGVPVPVPPIVPSGTPVAVPEVTVTESFSVVAPGAGASGSLRPTDISATGPPKGAVLRILPSGEIDTLWTSSEETPHALARSTDGVLVGTGNKGKLFRIRDDRTWSMVAAFPADQVTALLRTKAGAAVLATSNPGRLYSLPETPGTEGTFVSKVRDTEAVSGWGRLRWEGQRPSGAEILVHTRSGNTATPDSTWTDWSLPYTQPDGQPITSESARFLQVKATLTGKDGASPELDSVTAAYLQRNLRPQVQTVTVHPAGEVFQKPISVGGETEILGLETPPDKAAATAAAQARTGMPPATVFSRKLYQKGIQTFSWKADDPNGDTLLYEVHYRTVDDRHFRLLRRTLTEPVVAWDTSTVPNGRYVIRVTVSDGPGNPAALALSASRESAPFDIDNTPPVLTVTAQKGRPQVRAVARDDDSLIRRAEYSVDGGRWEEVHPRDGISDAREETYEITLSDLPGPGPHLVVVRAVDQLGNSSTGRVEIP
jgi:outer membrane protein assembly factor BamB